ncbi:MAG: hypothetical protein ACI9MC_003672 [Kiritimatiellia bacterium]|jgi:hypothetical protein
MSFMLEKREAMRMLEAIENASLPNEDIRPLLEDADPALVYFIFAWLRGRYGGGHPAGEGVLGRVVELCGYSGVARQARVGERDAIVAWFAENYEYREFTRDEFIDLVVDKLEG